MCFPEALGEVTLLRYMLCRLCWISDPIVIYSGRKAGRSLPARPVGENDVTLLTRPLCKGHTGVFLPVTHRLTEDGSLAACKRFRKKKKKKKTQLATVPHGGLPLKFPLITYGMMPSGHTLSGLEVAALRWRPKPRPPLAETQ